MHGKLNIISHRGLWQSRHERNTEEAFRRSWLEGFGIETDIRDRSGVLVVSHDPPNSQSMPLAAFLRMYRESGGGTALALNIKSDGLHRSLRQELEEHEISNYFVFDMSIPDTIPYLKGGLRVFTRLSEFEPTPAFLSTAAGIWLDIFESDWPDRNVIDTYTAQNLEVCLVSPELHGRDKTQYWKWISSTGLAKDPRISICTDYPAEAREYFNARD